MISFIKSKKFQFNLNQVTIFIISGVIMFLMTRWLTYSVSDRVLTTLVQGAFDE